MGEGVTLVDGDGVGHTITGVKDDAGGTTRGVQGEHGLENASEEIYDKSTVGVSFEVKIGMFVV